MSDTYIGTNVANNVGATDGYRALYGIGGDDLLGTNYLGLAYLEGGEGNDYLWTSWSAAQTYADIYGGGGNDFIQAGSSSSGDFIYGGVGDDAVEQNPNGPGSNDYIFGGQGRDSLRGEGGDDLIYGGPGDDSGSNIFVGPNLAAQATPGLFGGPGNDILDGGGGDDLLVGGTGKDRLIGGDHKDRFDFNDVNESPAGKQRDTIVDFRKGDKIDLSDIDAKSGPGNQKFDFIGKSAFSGDKGELRLKNNILQGDTNGDKKADFEVKVDGVSSLKDGDFVL